MTLIKSQVEETTSSYDKEKLQERLAKLAGGVAVIKVGAATETEQKEIKLRIEDALNSTRAAVEEGIVPGGGTAYLNIKDQVAATESETDDEATGVKIVVRALEEPIRQIAENAGKEGSVVINEVLNAQAGTGYNAATDQYEDMIASGIVDPTKVTRSALQNAASVAALLLTTEAIVAEIPKDEPDMPGAPGGMGMM